MPFMSAINPKMYEKTCYWLLIINLAKLTVHYNKDGYVWDKQVYKFTVHCIVYGKLLLVTSLQVYTTIDSLQQVVATYKPLTNQGAITLFHCW